MAIRNRREYRVFVSHATADRWIARQCARLIEEAGRGSIRTFLDEKDIDAGELIAGKILDGIRGCNELVVLFSE